MAMPFLYQRSRSIVGLFQHAKKLGKYFAKKIVRNLYFLHYRRLEGTSNNKVHVRWGAAQEDLIRDAPPMYADGIVMAAGANRPSPRKISNELFQQVRLK